MKCQKCGGEIPNNATVCPFCDSVIIRPGTASVEAQAEELKAEIEEVSNHSKEDEQEYTQETTMLISPSDLYGKKQVLISTIGMNMRGIFNSKVISEIEFAEDRMYFQIRPKRLNVSPVIMYEDVLSVDLTSKVTLYHMVFIVISVLLAISTIGISLIAALIFYFAGRNTQITINQRNGIKVVMYSNDKKEAETLKESIKIVAGVK